MKSADVRRNTLTTTTGETISYRFLIIATGARVLDLTFSKLDLSKIINVYLLCF